MIRRPPRSTLDRSSAASDVYKRQVVDDAIVVVENVERWIEQGMAPRDAARKAMDEVTPAVIAIAFGLSAVFILSLIHISEPTRPY